MLQNLPQWRISLAGAEKQPLTFQWSGDPEPLVRLLTAVGWTSFEQTDFKLLLNLFNPQASIQQLPLLPQLERGHTERLLLATESALPPKHRGQGN